MDGIDFVICILTSFCKVFWMLWKYFNKEPPTVFTIEE